MKKYLFYGLCFGFLFIFMINPVFASMEGCAYLKISIDSKIANAVHTIILVIQVVVPVLLVVFGSIDFVKAMISQKDEEIKKGQQTFIKRLIAGALVFFVIAIVKLIISFAAGDKNKSIINCANCFLNGANDCKVKN